MAFFAFDLLFSRQMDIELRLCPDLPLPLYTIEK